MSAAVDKGRYVKIGESEREMNTLLSLLPILWLILALSVFKLRAWQATVSALVVAIGVAALAFREVLPLVNLPGVVTGGVLFALHPICLIILAALFTYGVTVESGAMKTIRAGLARITDDRRALVLIIVWGFGNFMEGMAGYGTAVAIPAAILVGIGFDPVRAVLMCLIANTTPTAFGAVGVPLKTLADASGQDAAALCWTSAGLQAAVTAAGPVLVLLALDGWKALKGMGTLLALTEAAFFVPSLLAARFLGYELPDILGGVAVMLAVGWYVTRGRRVEGLGELALAAVPFAFVVLVLGVAAFLPPQFKRYASPGALVLVAGFAGGLVQGLSAAHLLRLLRRTLKGYWAAFVTTCAVLALARVMSAAEMVQTIAAALVAVTGTAYPYVSALVGALGGFVTGSGTSSCALFGGLQASAAQAIGASPVLLAAANVMGAGIGKMICPQSIAIGAAAAGLVGAESRLLKSAFPWFVGVLAAACLLTGLIAGCL